MANIWLVKDRMKCVERGIPGVKSGGIGDFIPTVHLPSFETAKETMKRDPAIVHRELSFTTDGYCYSSKIGTMQKKSRFFTSYQRQKDPKRLETSALYSPRSTKHITATTKGKKDATREGKIKFDPKPPSKAQCKSPTSFTCKERQHTPSSSPSFMPYTQSEPKSSPVPRIETPAMRSKSAAGEDRKHFQSTKESIKMKIDSSCSKSNSQGNKDSGILYPFLLDYPIPPSSAASSSFTKNKVSENKKRRMLRRFGNETSKLIKQLRRVKLDIAQKERAVSDIQGRIKFGDAYDRYRRGSTEMYSRTPLSLSQSAASSPTQCSVRHSRESARSTTLAHSPPRISPQPNNSDIYAPVAHIPFMNDSDTLLEVNDLTLMQKCPQNDNETHVVAIDSTGESEGDISLQEHLSIADRWTHKITTIFQKKLRKQMISLSREPRLLRREFRARMKDLGKDYSRKMDEITSKWSDLHRQEKGVDLEKLTRSAADLDKKNKKLRRALAASKECIAEEESKINDQIDTTEAAVETQHQELQKHRFMERALTESLRATKIKVNELQSTLKSAQKELFILKTTAKEKTTERMNAELRVETVRDAVEKHHQKPLIQRQIEELASLIKFEFFMWDDFEVDLTCKMCFNFLHDPVTLWPCGHTICRNCAEHATILPTRRTSVNKMPTPSEGVVHCADCGKKVPSIFLPNVLINNISKMFIRQRQSSTAQTHIESTVDELKSIIKAEVPEPIPRRRRSSIVAAIPTAMQRRRSIVQSKAFALMDRKLKGGDEHGSLERKMGRKLSKIKTGGSAGDLLRLAQNEKKKTNPLSPKGWKRTRRMTICSGTNNIPSGFGGNGIYKAMSPRRKR